jgi:hypothetical protein
MWIGWKHGKLDQKVHLPKIPFKNMTFFTKTQESRLESFILSFWKHQILCLHWVYGKLSIKFEEF